MYTASFIFSKDGSSMAPRFLRVLTRRDNKTLLICHVHTIYIVMIFFCEVCDYYIRLQSRQLLYPPSSFHMKSILNMTLGSKNYISPPKGHKTFLN